MRPIAVANKHPGLRIPRGSVERVIHTLDAHHAELATTHSVLGNEGEFSVVFMTDPALAKLHDDFLQDPSITDVITFEGSPAIGTAGELCVSADAAVRHCRESAPKRRSIDPEAFREELTLYVVHGWLHLAGYDDLQPAKKRIMRRAEARAMKLLRAAGAVPEFRLRA